MAEGWANYREWKMCINFLDYNPIINSQIRSEKEKYNYSPKFFKNRIYYLYSGLFEELSLYYTDKQLEYAVSTNNNITNFNQYIINNIPNKQLTNTIKNKLNEYATFENK